MTRTELTRKIAKFAVKHSVGWTVANIAQNSVSTEKPHQKLAAMIGGYSLGWMAADLAEEWTDGKLDEIYKMFQDAKQENKN